MQKIFTLKNGAVVTIRKAEESDAAALLDLSKKIANECIFTLLTTQELERD